MNRLIVFLSGVNDVVDIPWLKDLLKIIKPWRLFVFEQVPEIWSAAYAALTLR